MKTHQKTALSLLLAVVVFSAFAVLSYTGLFDYIEATFYDPRVRDRVRSTLDRGAEVIDTYHANNQQRFAAVLTEPAVRSVYRVNQARDDIVARRNFFARLEEQVPALAFVRFIDSEAQRLWYSTLPADIAAETDFRREYAPLGELDEQPPPAELVLAEEAGPDIVLDPANNHFIYRFPVEDEFGLLQGTALFYLGPAGATDALVRNDVIGVGERVVIAGEDRVVANYAPRFGADLRETLSGIDLGGGEADGAPPVITAGEGRDYLLFGHDLEAAGRLVYLAPAGAFEMSEIMRWVLLAATFLSVFLLAFLILNIRQDPEVVLTERVKRFQINLLRELFESGERADWEQKRIELEERRDEVNRRIKRGIGRLSPAKEQEVDALLEKSWDEILDVMGSRARVEDRSDRIDLERLEDMIEKVMAKVAALPSAGAAGGAGAAGTTGVAGGAGAAGGTGAAAEGTGGAATPPPSVAPSAPQPVEVEELEEAEAAEPEDLEEIEEAEPAEEEEPAETEDRAAAEDFTAGMQPVEVETVEEGEEDLEALEEAEEGEPEELEEAEAAEELDAAGELEEIDEAEEIGEPEELEELEDAETPSAAGGESPEDVAEFGKLEETSKFEQMSGRETVEAARGEAGEPPSDEELLRDLSEVREEWEEEGEAAEAETAPEAGPQPAVQEPPTLRPSEQEEVEVEGLDELEPAEEAEEPEELEAAEEAEELEPAEETGELEEPEELEAAEEPAELEPAEEAGELEPVDELEAAAALEPEELESVDTDAEEAEEPLELAGSKSAGDVHMSDWFSFTRHGTSRLDEEDAEEAELIEDFEEALPRQPQPAEEEEEEETEDPYRIEDELIVFTSSAETDNRYFQIVRLDRRVSAAGDTGHGVFTADDGVVQIDRRVYEESHETGDAEVRTLVDSIVGEEEDETAGIDDLLAPGGGLDLLPVGQKDESPGFGAGAGEGRRTPTFSERGLDYDAILDAYPDTEGGILKSLVEFTRSWGARAAGVLMSAEGEMRLDYSLAIEERCRRNFIVPETSDVYRHVLRHRSLLLTREPLHRFRSFHGLCTESALAYIGPALLLPIVFRGEDAYLVLGVREEAQNVEELLANAGMGLPGAVTADAGS